MSEPKLKLTPVVMRRHESLKHTDKAHFDKLRRALLKEHGPQCSICGAGPKVQAHEVWTSQVKQSLLFTLQDIILVCVRCHHTLHDAVYPAPPDWIPAEHFCRVNGCAESEYQEALAEQKAAWAKLRAVDELPRVIDFGHFNPSNYDPWETIEDKIAALWVAALNTCEEW